MNANPQPQDPEHGSRDAGPLVPGGYGEPNGYAPLPILDEGVGAEQAFGEHRAAHESRSHAPLPQRDDLPAPDDAEGWAKLLDRIMAIQRPIVLFQIRQLRRRYPHLGPTELVRKIELQYLNSITATGGGAGAAAVVPGIGTAAALAVTGVETVGFLEMTALFGQSVAEIHGLAVSDPVRARTLIQSLLLGAESKSVVQHFAGRVLGRGPSNQAFWGEIVTKSLPQAFVGELAKQIQSMFVKRFVVRQSAGAVGRLIPFGVGAVIGGVGNRMLGRQVVQTAREAFGPAPSVFPLDLHPDPGMRPVDAGTPSTEVARRGPFLFFRIPRALPRGKGRGKDQ